MTAIFDIESNGFYDNVTTIHCISIKVDDAKTAVYTSKPIKGSQGSIEEGLAILEEADYIVGHNIINYDIPVIQKLYPTFKYKGTRDTLIMSQLAYPNILIQDMNKKTMPGKLKGSHSLKAWGYRLRKHKIDFGDGTKEQWDILTEDMVEYCRQDSEVTYHLYNKLLTRNIPEEAIRLEQGFAKIISRQEKYGVYFDIEKAQKLHVELLTEIDKAEAELFKVFTPLKDWIEMREVPQFTKKGEISKVWQSQLDKGAMYNDNLEWGRWEEVVFNPGSRHHIARWLSEVYGWKPKEFTEKGSIIINDDVLNELEFPEGKILAHYFNVKKLLGQLVEGNNAWMKMVGSDGRIHGRVNTLGAVSRRCTHSTPNMAQVPSTRAYKGHEARELFTVPKGKKLVGCDADGLELRTLSHYMARFDGGKYGQAVDEGDKDKGTDIHTVNQKGAGLPTRDDAKTFIYAFLYGAGDAKIGTIVGGDAEDGKRLKEQFFRKIPAIKKLVDAVGATYKETKTLKALDGNPYHIRSAHSALNTLLQGAGALVMKYYLIALDEMLQASYTPGKEYEFVLNVHDEVQIECDENIAQDVATTAQNAFDVVTELLNFRIPLRGTAAIGDSWADTH